MKSTEKELKRIFDHELSVNDFPYRRIFAIEPFNRYLYNEFKDAEKKPCLWLYQDQYYSKEEYKKAIAEANDRIPRYSSRINIVVAASHVPLTDDEIKLANIYDEFVRKVSKNTLEPQFYCPNILKTPIVSMSKRIETIIGILRGPGINNERVTLYVNGVYDLLSKIEQKDLREAILNEILQDNENYNIEFFGGTYAEWKQNKFEFNELLKNKKLSKNKLTENNTQYNKTKPPIELTTEKSKALFNKAIECGFISKNKNLYKWLKTDALLAYFIDCANDHLELRKGNGRIQWKPFCIAFEITNNKNLRDAVNEYKNKTGSFPTGYKEINLLFD